MTNKAVKTVTDRVRELEIGARSLLSKQQQFEVTLGEIIETLQAMLAENGQEYEAKIVGRIEETRAKLAAERDSRAADALQKMVNDGLLVPVEKVTAQSLVVGRVLSATGELTQPRVQGLVSTIPEPFRGGLTDQTVGGIVEDERGVKFELLEVYDFATPQAVAESAPVPEVQQAT